HREHNPPKRLTRRLTRSIEDLDMKLHSPDRIEIVIVEVPRDGDLALRTLDGFPLESKKPFVWSREALRRDPSGTREAEGRWEDRGHCDDQHAAPDVGEALHDKGSFYHELSRLEVVPRAGLIERLVAEREVGNDVLESSE